MAIDRKDTLTMSKCWFDFIKVKEKTKVILIDGVKLVTVPNAPLLLPQRKVIGRNPAEDCIFPRCFQTKC